MVTNTNYNFDKLKVEKCNKIDWAEVLKILEETKLSVWFTGKERYEDFYVVKESDTLKMVCCFTFAQEDHIGILKNFAVAKDYQGKGIATYVANNILPQIASERDMKRLYLHGNDRGPFTSIHFWRKTIFKHIMSTDVKDKFYIDYFNHLVNNYPPELLYKEAIFYLDLGEL